MGSLRKSAHQLTLTKSFLNTSDFPNDSESPLSNNTRLGIAAKNWKSSVPFYLTRNKEKSIAENSPIFRKIYAMEKAKTPVKKPRTTPSKKTTDSPSKQIKIPSFSLSPILQ